MTSIGSGYGQVPSNKLYINIAACQSSILTSNGTPPAWVADADVTTVLQTVGGAIFRDLGTSLYLPSPTNVPVGAVAGISTLFRKVQFIPPAPIGAFGVGGAYAGSDVDYYTGYIQLGGLQQGGGGNGAPTRFARLN